MPVVPVYENFSRFISDVPRDRLPRNAAFRMKDWIPNEGAAARRRGAFKHASRDLQEVAPVSHGNTGLRTGIWAPFRNQEHLMIGSGWGAAYRVADFDGDDGNYVGDFSTTPARPAFWPGATPLVIVPHFSGATVPPDKYYPASGEGFGDFTTGTLGGSPPHAFIATVWGDFLVLGRMALNYRRIQWSLSGNPESWPALGTYDAPEAVVHIVARENLHLIWGARGVHLLIGDTPPPGGNLVARPYYFNQGTVDARSVVEHEGQVIWANHSGVWRSDGTSNPVNLTEVGGISRYWRSLTRRLQNPYVTGMAITAGLFRSHYVVTVLTRDKNYPFDNTFTTLLCDLDRAAWFEFQGLESIAYIRRPSTLGPPVSFIWGDKEWGNEELFFVSASHMTVEKMSTCWDTLGGLDPYSSTPKAALETGIIKLGSDQEKRFRRAFITSDVRSVAGSVPSLDVSSTTLLEEQPAYSNLKTLPATTKAVRRPVSIGKRGKGVALKIEQSGNLSADISLHGLEIDGHVFEAEHA